jgi:hypothetical protein
MPNLASRHHFIRASLLRGRFWPKKELDPSSWQPAIANMHSAEIIITAFVLSLKVLSLFRFRVILSFIIFACLF